jgi:hypothetical protein
MEHLTNIEIDALDEQRATATIREHILTCEFCRTRVTRAAKLDRALRAIPRHPPAPDLAARINAALADGAGVFRFPWRPVVVGLATALAALFFVTFVYQTVVALQDGGAFEFIRLFASRPEIVSAYPNESLAALVEAMPLVEMLMTFGALVMAAVLLQQFVGSLTSNPFRRATG